MRRWVPIVAGLGLVATAAVALAQVGGSPRARAAVVATAGSFEISDWHEGQPIFAATGIAPGESAQGTVAIEDTGSVPVALVLRRGELVDAPGAGGGALSGRLQLTVVDVTEPAAPRTVYAGPLATMPDQPTGGLDPDQARTFEFTATLPEAGAPSFQNAVQGASTTVAYSWVAKERNAEEEPSGVPIGGGPGGGGSGSQSGGEAEPAGGSLDLLVPKIRRTLRSGRLVAWISCDRSCRLQVRGRLRAQGPGTHRAAKIEFATRRLYAPGGRRVKIPVSRGLRRWLQKAPGRERLRAKLHFVAVGADGERDTVHKTMKLHIRGK
jgi:hypothetical protein